MKGSLFTCSPGTASSSQEQESHQSSQLLIRQVVTWHEFS